MKKKLVAIAAAVGCLMGSVGVVSAQDELPKPEVGQEEKEEATRVAETTEYNFTGDVVRGELKKPDGVVVIGDPGERLSSLIEVRADFVDRLIVSAEEL